MIKKVVGLHFSPLGGTAKITERIAAEIAADLNEDSVQDISCECFDLASAIKKRPVFDENTIVVIGLPVRIGKVPLPAVAAIKELEGRGARTVALVSYGTPTYGNALYELYNCVENNGFEVIGAGAFITKHNGTRQMTLSRPDMSDMESILRFCRATSAKLKRLAGSDIEGLRIKPAPLLLAGKMPVHKISRISPKAAAIAELTFEKATRKRREPEWFL